MATAEEREKKHVVVVGGGFAGVAAARELAKYDVKVTLIDKNRYHTFQPMLYQVATALIAAGDIAYPLEHLAEKHEFLTFLNAEVTKIDPQAKAVTLSTGDTLSGDYLIICAGAEANFYGVPGAEEFTYPMYTLHDANRLKSHIVELLLEASKDPSNIPEGVFNFEVVGAGPTGVETAGHIADLFHFVVRKEYPELDNKPLSIELIDGGKAPLSSFHDKAQKYTIKRLNKLGVTQTYETEVKEVTADSITLGDGSTRKTRTVVWAGGSKASKVLTDAGLPVGPGGRVNVDINGAIDGFPNVFALGDIANTPDPDGQNYPGLGSVALQQGTALGKNIVRDISGQQWQDFDYFDKGTMAMISKHSAVAELGKKHHTMKGPIAFTAWLGVHLLLLEGVREKAGALSSWAKDAISTERSQLRVVQDEPEITWDESEPSIAQQDAKSGTKTEI